MPDRIVLPRNAVRNDRVMTVSPDNRLAFSTVEIAYRVDDVVVLDTPLPPGTRVIVSDPSPVIEGMLLDPVVDDTVRQRLAAAAAPRGSSWDPRQ